MKTPMKTRANIFLYLILFSVQACKSTGIKQSALEGEKTDDPSKIPQYVRFDLPLASLEKSILGATDLSDAAKKFVNGPARIAAYQIQALGRIYQNQNKWFKELREEFQTIEDSIGAYDKWNNILTNGSKSLIATAKAELESNRTQAFEDVKRLLADNSWYGTTASRGSLLRQKLAAMDWEKTGKDRSDVLDHIAGELKEMRDTDYQFKNLEKGKGLHELRRDMKWILIEMRVLNGLVLKDTSACTYKKYAPLPAAPIAKSKYSELPSSILEQNPCMVPECLFLGIVQAVDDIGKIKDEAEIRLNTSNVDKDKVPDDLRSQAEGFYKEMSDGKLFGRTYDAVKSCVK